LLPRVDTEDRNLNMPTIDPAIEALRKFSEENPVELSALDPLKDPNIVIEHNKNTEIVGTKRKGTIMKTESGFLCNKGEEPFKGLHREYPTRTIPQRGLSPLLKKRGDRGEPSGK
jgi:hypothetical protein